MPARLVLRLSEFLIPHQSGFAYISLTQGLFTTYRRIGFKRGASDLLKGWLLSAKSRFTRVNPNSGRTLTLKSRSLEFKGTLQLSWWRVQMISQPSGCPNKVPALLSTHNLRGGSLPYLQGRLVRPYILNHGVFSTKGITRYQQIGYNRHRYQMIFTV